MDTSAYHDPLTAESCTVERDIFPTTLYKYMQMPPLSNLNFTEREQIHFRLSESVSFCMLTRATVTIKNLVMQPSLAGLDHPAD
jgi:hypothetical protein